MPSQQPTHPAFRAAFLGALLLTATGAACGDRADAGAAQGAGYAEAAGGEPARIEVDPCGLLTKEEISQQLFLAVPIDQREHYKTNEFDIETTEPDLGMTRMCEYRFASRDSVGDGPTWHSDFNLMVFPSNLVALPEDKRRPIDGAGSGMFKEAASGAAYYVVKGDLAVSLTRFPGRGENEEGGPDAGRVALLRHIAERLP